MEDAPAPQVMVVSKETLRELYPEGRPVELPPARPPALPADDRKTAAMLAQFNRRARQAFWSERRHGASEEQAFAAAERTLPR